MEYKVITEKEKVHGDDMKSDDLAIPEISIPEIKTVSPLSTPRDRIINITSEDRVSSDSSDSSPSDLRKRLEDLPSPNEFSLLTDRVAALGRRIGRKRELFLRLHGVSNRIEENDEWEDEESRTESWKSSLGTSGSKDARARRRARIRSESSSQDNDREMVISRSEGPIDPAKITDDDKSNPAESSVDRSARDNDCLKLPTIEITQRQSRASSLSEPSSTRCSYRNSNDSRDIKRAISALHSCRSFVPRDDALKSIDFPSVSPFSLNNVRPKRFGGYRPSSGVILKQLSSGSESESVNGTNHEPFATRKIDNSIETLELSSPESKVQVDINKPVKKMPIMPARNDIIESILPNLLPSSRSLDDDNLDRRITQDTSVYKSCVLEQINRDGYTTRAHNELRKINRNVARTARCDELTTKPCNELRTEPKYEDTHDERKELPQNTLTFSTRSFTSESAEVVTSICNEQIHNDSITKTYNEFKQIKSDFGNKRNQKEQTEIHDRDDIKDQFIFNRSMDHLNLEVNSSENIDRNVLATSEWNRLTSLYTQEVVETPHLTERIQSDTLEEALSSRASGPFESEGHSRSSCTPKIYLQQEALSSRFQNNNIDTSDNYQEIITKVPALALNSQDISYSTSAGSREYSATRPLDPHALIRALSDVSLKRKRQENVSRKREDFYHHDKDTIDASNRANKNFPTKGETWRVSRSSESPRKSLSPIPSRIPIRIKSSKITSFNEVSTCNKHLENSNKNEENASFFNNRSRVNETVIRQLSINEDMEELYKSGTMFQASSNEETIKYEVDDLGNSSSNLRNPLSAPFGDYIYDRTRCFPATGSGRKNCQLFNKTVYSGDRDYAKIDDDARSRSDHSMSRKSADTIDITSVTQSSYVFKSKKNESLRNAEENVTWRTEDDCASINDEENSEDMKDRDYYSAYDEKSEEIYSQTKEHLKLATERTCNPSTPFTIQHLQLYPSLEIKKDARKQQAGDDSEFNSNQLNLNLNFAKSENTTFRIQRKRELSEISSSTFNLNCESKRKKKSQERFPFTISEASAIKHQDESDYLLPDENHDCREKMNDQLEEKTVHQLQTHPSITRLATSGLEDTVADILCCVAQEKKEVKSSSKSRMKTFVRRIFSSKLRRAPKQLNNDNKTLEPTKVIYENRACQVNSKANSCSGDSSTEEARRINFDKFSCSSNMLKRESLRAIAQKHPCRRYDRDDLWIQDIKEPLVDIKKDNMSQVNNLKENIIKEPYLFFLARDQFDKLSESDIDRSFPKQHMLLSDCISINPGKQSTERNQISNVIPEDIGEDLTGCICWKFCRIIAPSRYRSSIRDQVSSSRTKRSSFLLWKRKK